MKHPEFSFEVIIPVYNGEKYLKAQLDSILEQRYLPERIIISDDGSIDASLDIIHSFAAGTTVSVVIEEGPRKGVVENVFFALAKTKAEYVFLADQDDVWLPNKVELFCDLMTTSKLPHLIFSDAILWFSNQKRDKEVSFWLHEGIDPVNANIVANQVFRNSVQGASMAINRALINKLGDHSNVLMHDWWCALIACSLGDISVIDTPTLLYRQHENNLVGADTGTRTVKQKFEASRKIFKQGIAFGETFKGQFDEYHSDFFDDLTLAFRSSRIKRLLFLLKYKPSRKNRLRSLTLLLSILLLNTKALR